jgi:hypothetical protein
MVDAASYGVWMDCMIKIKLQNLIGSIFKGNHWRHLSVKP